jgi:hypothetical protein
VEEGCVETRSAGTQFNLTGKLTLRIESKAQLIQTRMQWITSGYRYSSERGQKRLLADIARLILLWQL